ncbi:tyrosine-type recombinase/integrase [Pseudonocardia nantongensis]|uniref:tyrosine-type recombinase/integrase n=1 Tax=Pseudonocardia nantongensis TaxID=1181885 RepID=UPI00397AF9FA
MTATYRVNIWTVVTHAGRRRYGVRWKTDNREHSEWYATKRLAESFRSDLLRAQRVGEAFETASGLPVSLARQRNSRTLLEVATAYVDWLWTSDAPPNTRKGAVTNLAAAVPLFVRQLDHAPDRDVAQRLLSTRLLPVPQRRIELSPADRAAASWLTRASRPINDLADEIAASELLLGLGKSVTGRSVTTSTWDKRRAVLHRAMEFARASGWIDTNPLTGRRHLARHTGPQVVDPRVVINPAQARQLLAAVTYVQGRRRRDSNRGARLHAFFACLYYGGLRPGEAQNLRTTDLDLPSDGWGRLLLAGSRTEVSASYYAPPGARHQDRPLKRRSAEEVRPVPIPPDLVTILRDHVAEFPPAPDGRLFVATESGGSIPWSVYSRIWADARTIGLSPVQEASPLARRPYDLRHAALSSWLAAGVPPTEVAGRAGNSVKVLLTVYAKCLADQQSTYNERISGLLDS